MNEAELALLEEMEDKRSQFLDLLEKCFEKGLETKKQFLSIPAEEVVKVKWHELLEFSMELHQDCDEERRIRTIKLVARFLNSLDDLKKTPTNNIDPIEIQLLMVTGEMYDVPKLWKEPKKGSFDATNLVVQVEMKADQLNNDALDTNHYSKPMKKAVADLNEVVNVTKATDAWI